MKKGNPSVFVGLPVSLGAMLIDDFPIRDKIINRDAKLMGFGVGVNEGRTVLTRESTVGIGYKITVVTDLASWMEIGRKCCSVTSSQETKLTPRGQFPSLPHRAVSSDWEKIRNCLMMNRML